MIASDGANDVALDGGDAILAAESIVKDFGGVRALNQATIAIPAKGISALIGPNGAGKTTLFNVLTGATRPTSGRVLLAGSDITGRRADQIARLGVARTFQSVRVFGQLTTRENIIMGAYVRLSRGFASGLLNSWSFGARSTRRAVEREADELLAFVGLAEMSDRRASSLVLGAQRRLEIARGLAMHPNVLLLDEPASGMNSAEKGDLERLVRSVDAMGIAVLLIEHNMELVMKLARTVFVLNYGRMIAHGLPEQVQASEEVIEAYLGTRRR